MLNRLMVKEGYATLLTIPPNVKYAKKFKKDLRWAKKKKKGKKKPVFDKIFVEIERESTLPGGVTVDGVGKLKAYLVNHRKRDFAKGLVERILAYALSRDIDLEGVKTPVKPARVEFDRSCSEQGFDSRT